MPEASDVTVVSVGEGLVVFTPEPPRPLAEAQTFARSLGGAELNVAIALQTAGVRSAVVGRVGDDGFGEFLLAELGRYGVDTSAVERDPHAPTGLYVKEVSAEAAGIADRMHYYRSSSAGSLLSRETLQTPAARSLLEQARIVHTTGVTSALSSSALLAQESLFQDDRGSGIRSFSVHWRPPLWLGREDVGRAALADLARRADVVFVSEADALSVFGATDAGALRALLPEPRHLVVTHPTGATAFDGGTRAEAPPIDFRMIEPIGAEDAIAAGFLAGLVSGLSLEGSLARANRLATRVMSSTRDHLG
ncbi:sugar kinase [Microbacterium sp. NPDC057659]|uniref:sugar kinase n=1 Tax=Microbacterium sp. NPDC057659 TaxID=3346198 RepID=UPI00366C6F46